MQHNGTMGFCTITLDNLHQRMMSFVESSHEVLAAEARNDRISTRLISRFGTEGWVASRAEKAFRLI